MTAGFALAQNVPDEGIRDTIAAQAAEEADLARKKAEIAAKVAQKEAEAVRKQMEATQKGMQATLRQVEAAQTQRRISKIFICLAPRPALSQVEGFILGVFFAPNLFTSSFLV